MQAKNVLYAAVGAPVVAARKLTDQVNEIKGKVSKETTSYTKVANEAIDGWAVEGEKVVSGIRDGKVVEELRSPTRESVLDVMGHLTARAMR